MRSSSDATGVAYNKVSYYPTENCPVVRDLVIVLAVELVSLYQSIDLGM